MSYFTDISLIICNQPVIRIRTMICNTAPKYANHLADSKRDHKNKQQQCKHPNGNFTGSFYRLYCICCSCRTGTTGITLRSSITPVTKKTHKRIPKTDIRLFLIRCRCNIYYIPAFMVIVNFNPSMCICIRDIYLHNSGICKFAVTLIVIRYLLIGKNLTVLTDIFRIDRIAFHITSRNTTVT